MRVTADSPATNEIAPSAAATARNSTQIGERGERPEGIRGPKVRCSPSLVVTVILSENPPKPRGAGVEATTSRRGDQR
jgi:hypothetical protein